MKKINIILLVLFSALLITGCKEDDELIPPIDLLVPEYDNIPVKVNTQDSYTFTVSANNFNYSTEDALSFSSDSLVVTITSTNAESSNSGFVLYGSNNSVILSEELNESKVTVNTNLTGSVPVAANIELNNYTGKLTIVVAVHDN